MQQHNTHLLSEQSNENHGYVYDNFGNVIADSLDDLIYDKFIDIKERKKKKNSEARNLIKNIIDNEFFSDVSPKETQNNIIYKTKNKKEENIEENNIKRKSLINISRSSDKNNITEDGKENIRNNIKKEIEI